MYSFFFFQGVVIGNPSLKKMMEVGSLPFNGVKLFYEVLSR